MSRPSPRILYLAQGRRDYGNRPVVAYRRDAWEFQAITRGRCRVTFRGGAVAEARHGELWIFSPSCVHGWDGVPGKGCEVAVMHFATIPQVLEAWMEDRPFVRLSLGHEGVGEVARLVAEAIATSGEAGALRELRSMAASCRMATLAVQREPGPRFSGGSEDERKVERALAWFDAHLAEGPGVADAARAVGISAAHLRRLCGAVRGRSARALLEHLRLRRAKLLLAEPGLKLEAIAEGSGYGSAAAFARAFRRAEGVSPRRFSAPSRQP